MVFVYPFCFFVMDKMTVETIQTKNHATSMNVKILMLALTSAWIRKSATSACAIKDIKFIWKIQLFVRISMNVLSTPDLALRFASILLDHINALATEAMFR